MKKNLICTIVLFAITALAFICCSEKPDCKKDILFCLPESAVLKIWKPINSPQKYIGEDLYLYMNGGAVTYQSYGFKQLISQEYISQNNKTVNLEIFEMESRSGAYGMYSFKAGKNGKKIAFGNEGLLEDYYLNFWKGKYLVTLTGFDSDKETIDGLITIAKAVDDKIDSN